MSFDFSLAPRVELQREARAAGLWAPQASADGSGATVFLLDADNPG